MPRNVEIKAKVEKMAELKDIARKLANDEGVIIHQEDTFFNTPDVRLKLRCIKDKRSELISYKRPDQEGPKLSDFYTVKVEDGEALKTVLTHSLGVKGAVKKERLLIMYHQTRIHLDTVDGLGDFMELEVQLRDDQTTDDGDKIAKEIMSALHISPSDLIDCAYMDMILNKAK